MYTFFLAQMDYVYFLYGLSFIMLAVACLMTKPEYKTGPRWLYLGLFGVFSGLAQWSEFVNINTSYTVGWLNILKLTMLTLSCVYLFEFFRKSLNDNTKIKVGHWVYLILLAVNLIGWYLSGWSGLELFVKFTLGVGGTVGAGVVFWQNKQLKKVRFDYNFGITAVSFWLFAISLLVNTSGELFGIKITDQNTFFQSVGIPIQIIKAILIYIISFTIWMNHQVVVAGVVDIREIIKKNHTSRYFVLAIILLIISGYVITNQLGYWAYKEIKEGSKKISDILVRSMEGELASGQNFSKILSGSPDIIKSFEEKNPDTILLANSVLDRYKVMSGVDIAYILDKDGNAILTSNRNDKDSLLGKNYSFRPYFINSISGKPFSMFAYGVTTKKAGFYSSYPIKNYNNEIVGVAVIKKNLLSLENNFKNYGVMFLVSPEGGVMLSGDEKYNLKSFGIIPMEEKKRLIQTQVFPKNSLIPLCDCNPNDGENLELDGKNYLFNRTPINGAGWEIITGYSSNSIEFYRLFGILIGIILYFLITAFFIIIEYIKRNTAATYAASVLFSTYDAIIGQNLSGVVVSWNKGAEKIYGYREDEILGKFLYTIIPNDKLKEHQINNDKILLSKKDYSFETVHIRKDRKLINVSLIISPIVDSVGSVVGVSTVSRDISREVIAEAELKKQMIELEKFKLAVDSSSDAIVITDKDGRVLYENKAVVKLSGYSMSETEKTYIGKLWGGHMEKSFYQKMWHTIKDEKKPFIGELKNRRKNGEEYVVMARFYPLLDNLGDIQFFVGVETDISKVKEMDRIKSEFVSIASHQLRTPLTGIKWFSELLLKGKAGDLSVEQKDFVQQVFDSNDRMIRLVDDLLDVSHIDEAGKFKIILVNEDFSVIIKDVVSQQKIQAKIKNIKISLSSACLDKISLKVDRSKLEQAMQNILSNAIKYSPNGSTISVDCDRSKEQYVCSFKDKGIGIPLYQQHRVFEKFFRADNVITVGSGTGLGLYIARYIIEGHGGKMWFESKENKGTTVYFSLPIK